NGENIKLVLAVLIYLLPVHNCLGFTILTNGMIIIFEKHTILLFWPSFLFEPFRSVDLKPHEYVFSYDIMLQELHKKRLQITEKPKYKRKPKGTTERSIKVTSNYKFTDKDASADSSPRDVHHMSSVTGIQGDPASGLSSRNKRKLHWG
ncbi:hypothetical protein ACJX0J_035370, partial [Zea mays]